MLKKINIIGTSGSGKTTFGRKLAEILSIDYIEMDALFWEENWSKPSDDTFFSKLKSALVKDAWVLDGNYNRTVFIKWEKVDTVIWLDFSFARTLIQAVRRAVVRAMTKEELWPGTGNRESFRSSFFSKESIILWTIQSYRRNRSRYHVMMTDEKYSHINFVRLRSPKQCAEYLRNLKNTNEASK